MLYYREESDYLLYKKINDRETPKSYTHINYTVKVLLFEYNLCDQYYCSLNGCL